ncbi:MAG TPA: hypothetical protein VG222_11195 [Vicinamibacterales bacterium]|nr:hypothetical protein [Vicinamibacterales bacterium]
MHDPVELMLEVRPGARFDLIDVRKEAVAKGAGLEEFPRALYCSFHTTAGYLEQGLASRLSQAQLGIGPYIHVFRRMFPEGAGYRHDDLNRREELTDVQRIVEPKNADAHLAFIAAGLSNCVNYVNRPNEPVYFVDLDGVCNDQPRRRLTSVIGFHHEEVVARESFVIPVSSHPIDSLNLKDSRIGLYEQMQELIGRHGIQNGRVHLALAACERHAGLTVNEYETLLMRHDLREVLGNPLRFVAEKGRNLLTDPWGIPNRTIDYATYDLVQVCNKVFEAFRMSESMMENLFARLVAVPARRFLRMKRSVSLLVTDRELTGEGTIAEGPYQCPILVQWARADGRQRSIEMTLTRLR